MNMKKITLLLCAIFIVACEKETERTTFQLTITADAAQGTVEPSEMASYFEGDKVQIMAKPTSEYVFDSWTGATGEATTTITMDATKNIVANFVKKKYELTVTIQGQGTVSETVVKTGATQYNSGSEIKLTANAAAGWIFEKWTGDTTGTDNPKNINITAAKNITAVFIQDVVLTASVSGSGTVTKQLVSGKTYTVTATADANWVFDKWTGGISGTDNPTNITLTEDTNVIAVFKSNIPISLASDGITLVAKAGTAPGEYVFNGVTYTVLDNTTLAEWVTASAGGAFDGDKAGTPASDAKDLTKAITTLCTDMSELFKGKATFNADISSWDVSNVTDMEGMFEGAAKFNQDVSKWDTGKVANMDKMFKNAADFNQDLKEWCVVNLTTEPTDFSTGTASDEDEKPKWGTWPGNPYLGNWVLDSYTVFSPTGLAGDLVVQDKSIFDPYLEDYDSAGIKVQYMVCEGYPLVEMKITYDGTVGKYDRKLQFCDLDGSKLELKTGQGYWIYNTSNKAIYADENLTDLSNVLINEDFRIDVEYTSDEKYFYASQWEVMPNGLEVYVTDVYKRVL